MAEMKSVCVYCGAAGSVSPAFRDAATELGRGIAGEGLRLVYGGGRVGLMGLVADAALAAGGQVTGVIPDFLDELEVAHPGVTELIRTGTMHERKMHMARLSDAFLVLPGGFGTLDETFEILTWKQLRLHDKPVVLLNINGFWDGLVALINHQAAENFVRPEHLSLFSVANGVEAALKALRNAPAATHDISRKWA